MVELYWVEAGLLIAAISVAAIGLAQGKAWARETWLIPVLVALLWGCLQQKNGGGALALPQLPQLGI